MSKNKEFTTVQFAEEEVEFLLKLLNSLQFRLSQSRDHKLADGIFNLLAGDRLEEIEKEQIRK